MTPSRPSLQQLEDLILNWRPLSLEQIEELNGKIKIEAADLEARLSLMGYFYYGTENSDWQEHFMWIAENLPAHPILGRIGHLIMDVMHPTFYEHVEALWLRKVSQNSACSSIFANAASCLKLSNLDQATLYIDRAVDLAPLDPEAIRIHRIICRLKENEMTADD